ncbi:MAG: transcriptional regulator GutM [Micropruina sp.]|uniref:transcriptional regulator GutM n=1 Tax=Micropruina sp. TaxID=2737536 RepID=UPI0039E6F50D
MNFWFLIVVLAATYLLQVGLSVFQMRDFATSYGALRRRGKIAIGKRKTAFSAGSIAMFLIDAEGTVTEATAISGLTVLARFKPLQGFDGMHISQVADGPIARLPRPLRLAILNARDNWLAVQRGETPQDPPGPLTRFLARFRRSQASAPRADRAPRAVHTEGVTS